MRLNKGVYRKAGLDAAIVFTILSRFIQSIGGIITLLLIARFLDKNEQGYFYTFTSILSVQIFFELGLTGIITQYVAHEAAHLTWKNNWQLEGDEYYKSRLASIVKLGTVWMLSVSVLLFFVFLLAGRFFFNAYNNHLQVDWQMPWLVLSLATVVVIVANLLFAILEGLGKVKEVTRMRLLQQLLNVIFIAVFFFADLKLLASGMALFASSLVMLLVLINSGHLKVIINLWKQKTPVKINYRKEVFPFQSRIALGSISGYLIYQLINPVLFATQGAAIAGQMGATQTFLNGILLVSLSWFSTKIALFSTLVAKRRYRLLKLFYQKNLFISVMVCVAGVAVFMGLVWLLQYAAPAIGNRFLGIYLILFLGLTQVASVIGNAQAHYLRSFKKEPFFLPSVVIGIASGIATVVCGKFFGISEIVIAYFFINGIAGFLWGCIIFRNNAYAWTKTRMII